ncbi:oxalate:formate antiporter [Vallitalea sediminicola]
MDKIRDLIYMNYEKESNKVISYGVEFREFIQALSKRPNNILVLEGYYGSDFDFTTNCEYCISEDIDEFIQEDVYSYGNFSWVDFESVKGLKTLEPQEVAELFYLSKMWNPVNDTFFEKLNNRFVYTAHDDGWINHTFYNNISDFQEVLTEIIINKVYTIYNIKLPKLNKIISARLCELSLSGFAVDILRLCIEEDNSVVMPIYQIGKYKDMDKVYTLTRESEVQVDFELKYSSQWELIELN